MLYLNKFSCRNISCFADFLFFPLFLSHILPVLIFSGKTAPDTFIFLLLSRRTEEHTTSFKLRKDVFFIPHPSLFFLITSDQSICSRCLRGKTFPLALFIVLIFLVVACLLPQIRCTIQNMRQKERNLSASQHPTRTLENTSQAKKKNCSR